MFIKALEETLSRTIVDSWVVPAGLVLMQIFPARIMHFSGSIYNDAALYKKFRNIPLLRWSDISRGKFYGMDVETLFALQCSAHGLIVKSRDSSMLILGRQ